jgi:hypothetical protein
MGTFERKGYCMETSIPVTFELPASVYADLQQLAHQEQVDIATLMAQLVVQAKTSPRVASPPTDPVLSLIGAYQSNRPLIDNIPVSEDPDLYILVDVLGEQAIGMHAWEIAPQRYRQGVDGEPVRCDRCEGNRCTILYRFAFFATLREIFMKKEMWLNRSILR